MIVLVNVDVGGGGEGGRREIVMSKMYEEEEVEFVKVNLVVCVGLVIDCVMLRYILIGMGRLWCC